MKILFTKQSLFSFLGQWLFRKRLPLSTFTLDAAVPTCATTADSSSACSTRRCTSRSWRRRRSSSSPSSSPASAATHAFATSASGSWTERRRTRKARAKGSVIRKETDRATKLPAKRSEFVDAWSGIATARLTNLDRRCIFRIVIWLDLRWT